jgi:hypothetical protein
MDVPPDRSCHSPTAKHNDGRGAVAPNMMSLLLTHDSLSHKLPGETNLWNHALQKNFVNIDALIHCMVDHGANPNQLTRFGNHQGTPFHFMLYHFSGSAQRLSELVQEWLDMGADLDREDSNGESVVDLILRKNQGLRRYIFKDTTLLMDRKHRIIEVSNADSDAIPGSQSNLRKRRRRASYDADGDPSANQAGNPRKRQPQIIETLD